METQNTQDKVPTESEDQQQPTIPEVGEEAGAEIEHQLPEEDYFPPIVQETDEPAKPGLMAQQVNFSNGNQAQLITPPADADSAEMMAALGLEQPKGLLLILGDATGLDEEAQAHLAQLFSRGIARAAVDTEALIIDGGRQSSLMAMMGKGVADRGRKSTLVGVAPAGKVTYPGGPAEGTIVDGQALDPNHSHFVLTEGDKWGDESKTMFDLATALVASKDEDKGKQPVVTILVSGDSLTKKQVLQSVRNGWPVITIRGTGGLADEIVQLSQERPPFIPDPDLAEIIFDGKRHFFDLDGSISGFERLLERLLMQYEADGPSTLALAWLRFAVYDANAERQQNSFWRLQKSMLILGVLGTLLALIGNQLKIIDPERSLNPLHDVLYYIILAIPISVTLLAAVANRLNAGTKWILSRASAESIKKEIYRYRTQIEIYSDQETKKTSRDIKLTRKIEAISSKLMQSDVNLSALKDYGGPIPPKYGAAPGDDGLSFLTPDRYLTYRLEDQLKYYRGKTVKLERQLQGLQWLIYLSGAAGTLLVAIQLELWIALTTALVTAFTAYMEYQKVEEKLMRYNQTANDLANILSWWIALSAEEQATPSNLDKLVGQTETTIHSEHAAWVQDMQDAMAEIRAEQSGAEEELAGGGETQEQA